MKILTESYFHFCYTCGAENSMVSRPIKDKFDFVMKYVVCIKCFSAGHETPNTYRIALWNELWQKEGRDCFIREIYNDPETAEEIKQKIAAEILGK